jgi:hypothetical protein
MREKYLTSDLVKALAASSEQSSDYFTQTEDFPKAFRVGTCDAVSDDKAELQVLLFWKDDTRSEQKEVQVEAVKRSDTWLINKVESR